MRENIRDKERLRHILAACDVILANKDCAPHDEIEKDPIRYFGFVKHVEIIGKATYKLTEEYRDNHPEAKWDIIKDMRHILVHGYYKDSPTTTMADDRQRYSYPSPHYSKVA